MLITDVLTKSAEIYKDKCFIKQKGLEISFQELEEKTGIMAVNLASIGQKDLMGIMVKNSIDYILCYFGIIRSGNIAVGINVKSKKEALKSLLEQKIRVLIVSRDYINEILKLPEDVRNQVIIYVIEDDYPFEENPFTKPYSELFKVNEESREHSILEKMSQDENDIAQVIFTSGTNGEPNGVCLTHKNLITNMNQIVARIDITEKDNMLVIIPFYYSYGNSLILSHLVQGAQLTLNMNSLLPFFILDDLIKYQCTSLAGVASNLIMLLKRTEFMTTPMEHLRYITLAGEPVSDWILEELVRKNIDIYVMYGQTEATARITILTPKEFIDKKGSVGRALDGEDIKIVDSDGDPANVNEFGEVIVSGNNIMKGYLSDESLTMEKVMDGYLHTGDIGRIDEDGYIYIRGRKDDMIKVGGERIFPIEIEKVILSYEKVKEVGVTGIIENGEGVAAYLGQTIYAFVVSDGNLTENELLQFCKENLQANKIPQKFVFVNELTRTNTGKLKRNALHTLL